MKVIDLHYQTQKLDDLRTTQQWQTLINPDFTNTKTALAKVFRDGNSEKKDSIFSRNPEFQAAATSEPASQK